MARMSNDKHSQVWTTCPLLLAVPTSTQKEAKNDKQAGKTWEKEATATDRSGDTVRSARCDLRRDDQDR